jgi:hypothetical protein
MLKLNELKAGDIITVVDDNVEREGVVVEISNEMHEALVDNGVQEFWYTQDEMRPVPLNEEQLLKLGFEKHVMDDQTVKYSKGAFRLVTPNPGDFSNIEMWYREDRRHFGALIGVHQLQNLHLAMTKVPLEMPA